MVLDTRLCLHKSYNYNSICAQFEIMKDKRDRLFEIAEAQQGYFTAGQAMACGYPTSSHIYHLKVNTWQREYRGIYRLTHFPVSAEGEYVVWALWSRNRQGVPQGVFSHQTALSLYELSDLMPARLHMTVPPGFRRSAPIPKVLTLYRSPLTNNEIEERQGFRVTRPIRAIADLMVASSISPDHLQVALQEGLKRGLITRKELTQHAQYPNLRQLL